MTSTTATSNVNTELYTAALNGHIKRIKELASEGANLEAVYTHKLVFSIRL